MNMPNKYEWVLTNEGRNRCKNDLDIMAKMIEGAGEITEKYGFVLTVSINEVKE